MSRTSMEILADARSAAARHDDVTDTLAGLVDDCREVLSAGAVGLFVRPSAGRINLLSSSAHGSAVLELFRVQEVTGPCIDAISADLAISVVGSEDVLNRWPAVGRAMIECGYQRVHASPLHWRGKAVGALDVLFVDLVPMATEQTLLAQAFADVATLVVMQSAGCGDGEAGERIRSALGGRTIIEQATGVLAYQQTLDMPSAYDALVRTSRRNRTSLTVAAEGVVAGAMRRSRQV